MADLVGKGLEMLCPCVDVDQVPGKAEGSVRFVAGPASDKAEFCDCLELHNTGCKLVHDLMTWNKQTSIIATDVENGSEKNPIIEEGAQQIQWNP